MTGPRRPLLPLRLVALSALAALFAAATWTEIAARMTPPEDPHGDAARQRVSLERARHAGEAMAALAAHAEALAAASVTSGAALGGPAGAADAAPPSEPSSEPAEEPTTADWSRCPAVSYEELAAVLVPDYLAELPRTDGWGHPLEYCFERTVVPGGGEARYRVGVRSPGRDGRWDGGDYAVGGFPPDAFDRDLLWLDGFLVTWPDPEPAAR